MNIINVIIGLLLLLNENERKMRCYVTSWPIY